MSETVVSMQNLVKQYGTFPAVDGVSIEVGRGEVLGLLGPNGAGKTTTLECLEGMRKANGGVLRVAGCDPQSDERLLRKRMGVQLQSSALPESIRAGEAVDLFCAWHGVAKPDALLQSFGIGEFARKQYRQLSTGQKRRLLLVLAMLHGPDVLVLDEPTAGLDVQSRAQLHEAIRAVRERGITVLLATHDMAEAEQLCDRIAILIKGKLAFCGTPEQVTTAGSRETRIRLRTQKGSLLPGRDMEGAQFIEEKDGSIEWRCRNVTDCLAALLARIQSAGDTVEDLRVERPSLEERFLELVKGAA